MSSDQHFCLVFNCKGCAFGISSLTISLLWVFLFLFFCSTLYQVGNLLFISMPCKFLALKKRAPFCRGTHVISLIMLLFS